jgi:hypothetical protein
VAVVAKEPGISVAFADVIRKEVEGVGHEFPVRDQALHVVVDGYVRVLVHGPAHLGEVPPPVVPGVVELAEVEGLRRGDDKEVSLPRVFVHVPVGRLREEQPVVSVGTDIVVFVRSLRVQQPGGPVCVDLEDRDIGIHGRPVVQTNALPPLQEWLVPTIEPNPGLQLLCGSEVLRRSTRCGEGQDSEDGNQASNVHVYSKIQPATSKRA